MPTYEYRCPNGHEFEQFQKMSDPPVAACPECGAEAERLLSAGAGVHFKGSGFYITDYRPEGYKKAAEAEKGATGGAAPDGAKSSGSEAPKSAGSDGAKGAKSKGGASGGAKEGGAGAAPSAD